MKTAVRSFGAFLLALLAGCQMFQQQLPVYLWEDYPAILNAAGTRYLYDSSVATTYGDTPNGVWKFAGDLGEEVGVCGTEPDKGGSFSAYTVTGDEENRFLCIQPNRYVFGPYYTYFSIREDVSIRPLCAEDISYAVAEPADGEDASREITDPEWIAALLSFYMEAEGTIAPSVRQASGFTVRFYHRDYPFLTAEMTGAYDQETGAVYLVCRDGARRELPVSSGEMGVL